MVVGLVGCGNWGWHILRDLIALGCEVPVVARSAESKARAREGGAAAIVDEIASLPRLDGAVVATSTSSHAVVLDELLALDVPALCEKPLPSVPANGWSRKATPVPPVAPTATRRSPPAAQRICRRADGAVRTQTRGGAGG
jgi:hypothetical protein